jgi:hypothetical protein
VRASIVIAALTVAPFVVSSARAQSDQKPKVLVTASRDRDDDNKLRGDRDDDKKCRHRKASANANEHGANRQKAAEKDCAAPPPPPPPPPPAYTVDISGSVFFDLDANGIMDPDEVGLSGWQVQVSGPVTQTATTDGNGAYSLTGLTAGNYTVCVLPPMGWTQVSPVSGATCGTGFGYSVPALNVSGNASFPGVNFGFISQ